MGIGIEAWRARIGGFTVFSRRITSSVKNSTHTDYELKGITLWIIVPLISYLLLACGDIQPNPGPVNDAKLQGTSGVAEKASDEGASAEDFLYSQLPQRDTLQAVETKVLNAKLQGTSGVAEKANDEGASAEDFLCSQLPQRDQKKPSTKPEKAREISTEIPRPFLAKSHPGYTFGNRFVKDENSPCFDEYFVRTVEYKHFFARGKKAEIKHCKEETFVNKAIPFICACLNARCDATMYFGVDDANTILGVQLTVKERKELKQQLFDAVKHKMCSDVDVNCRHCVKVIFVPIKGMEGSYVIEVDIEPKHEILGEAVIAMRKKGGSKYYEIDEKNKIIKGHHVFYERVPPDQTKKVQPADEWAYYKEVKKNATRRKKKKVPTATLR